MATRKITPVKDNNDKAKTYTEHRRLFPMFNWDNYIHSIVPEFIELNDTNIEFMCSDKYGCNTVWSIYAGLDEDLNIKEWRNSYW